MTLLDQVIDGATDSSVSTANLLRKFLVLGSRLKSTEIKEWASAELNGLGSRHFDEYPIYRGPVPVAVQVTFTGPGMLVKHLLSAEAVPETDGFRETFFNQYFNQPIAELERLTRSDQDAEAAWPTEILSQFQKWSDTRRTIYVEGFGVHSVAKLIPRTLVHGVIDNIRTRALELALDIQANFPEAGETGGPTFDDPNVRTNVTYQIQNNIYGGNNNVGTGENVTQEQNISIASGKHATQSVTITKGDAGALRELMNSNGLDAAGQEALAAAIEEDGATAGPKVKEFLDKITTGVFKFAGEVASPAMVSLAKIGIGGFFGVQLA